MSEKVNLRLTHPALYRSVFTIALVCICLGLNFLFTKPTFNPYGIDYRVIGIVFLIVGCFKLFSIQFLKSLKCIRASMVASVGLIMWWGIGTSFTFFTGQTSLQLFFLYTGYAALIIIWSREPYVNPLTGSNGKV